MNNNPEKVFLMPSSVSTRLTLSFIVILLLLLAVSLISIERFSLLTDNMRALVNIQAKNSQQARHLYQQSQASAIDLLMILRSMRREERVPLYISMDKRIAEADAALTALKQSNIPTTELKPVIKLREAYKKAFNVTVDLLEVSGLSAARKNYDQATAPILTQLLKQTMELDSFQQEAMQHKVEMVQKMIDQARGRIILIGIAALFVGFLLAFILSRSISSPLKKAVNIASDVAKGNYSGQLPQSNVSELQHLFIALGNMREEILKREQHISKLAYIDTLTGLANRTKFIELLQQSIESGSGDLAVINLNRFGKINQALGHAIGDKLLQQVAERLRKCLDNAICIARLDSDKFAFLITEKIESPNVGEQIQQLITELHQSVEIEGQRLDIDARVGVVQFPQDGNSLTDLLKQADLAIDTAKQRHLHVAYARDSIPQPAHEHLSLLGEMREALKNNQIQLAYQPKMNTKSREIIGVEALIRWYHPHKGYISPGLFIPFAEQTGFIRQLTPWVIHQALRDTANWLQEGIELAVSVNISTLDLTNPRLLEIIQDEFQSSSVSSHNLYLEITESALMDDPQQALEHLTQLAKLGVKLSIDDYGTGQASLAYVKDLPVNELKIDRSFISGIDKQTKQAAIVSSTILMCQQLGLNVVAEGIETGEEAEWLQRNNCDLLQGFGIAKPMPSQELSVWIHQYRGNH